MTEEAKIEAGRPKSGGSKLLGVVIVLILLVAAFFGYKLVRHMAATSKMAELGADLDKRIAGWKKKEYRRKPVYGDAVAGNAADFYRKMEAKIDKDDEGLMLLGEFVEHPSKPLEGKALEFYNKYKPLAEIIRKGAHAETYKCPMQVEKGFEAEFPSLLKLQAVSNLMVLYSRELAGQNRRMESLKVLCDAVRMGQDNLFGGPLITSMIGIAVSSDTYKEFLRVLGAGRLSVKELRELKGYLKNLMDDRPDFNTAWETEGLGYESGMRKLAEESGLFVVAGMSVWGGRATVVDAWEEARRFYSLMDTVVSDAGGKARDEAEKELTRMMENPASDLSAMLLPSLIGASNSDSRSVAQGRGAYILAELQLHRIAHGKYPKALDELGPDLPEDPFSESPFIYKQTPEGVKLYSVGEDGEDGSGDMDDVLICSLAPAAAPAEEPKEPNYDESNIPPYTLPDPLALSDGSKVTDVETWMKRRRPEVLRLFEEHVYGRAPGRPKDEIIWTMTYDPEALGGKAIRKEIMILPSGDKNGPRINLLVYLPRAAAKPVPAFVGINFRGNHSIINDEEISLCESWTHNDEKSGYVDHRATEKSRGCASGRWEVEKIIDRGYALATAYCGDIDPDFHDGFKNGVHSMYPAPKDDEWASIGAWAWGLSRIMDCFEWDKDIDEKKVVVMGHSRLGKTALWAGAQDTRFAIVISNNSGCGGAALSRRRFGETVKKINDVFPHWFCANFKKYNAREDDLPVDQHMLIALVAPRPVYVASAEKDAWADPKGEFLSAKNAEPVYKLFGKEGLGVEEWPPLDKPVGDTIGYHYRTGGHTVAPYDWDRYLDFADRHFGR